MKCVKISLDFAESIRQLVDAEAGRLLKAIVAYATTGEELTLSGNERILWGMMKKDIDAQRRSYDSKCESMAAARELNPNNQKPVSEQTDYCQETDSNEQKTDSKMRKEAGEKREKERSKEKERKDPEEKRKAPSPSPPPGDNTLRDALNGHSEELILSVDDWLRYKKEKRQSYTPTGLKTFLNKVARYADGYGDRAVTEAIQYAMSNSYQGVVWERLTPKGGSNGAPRNTPDHRERGKSVRYD